MTHSVNEIEALAMKAARGAGAPAAQAARFGKAVAQHLAKGRKEDDLTTALEALPNGPILSLALNANDQGDLAESYRDAAARSPLPQRLAPSAALVQTLSTLAAKTYVPASEASRLAGAGAGTSDND